MTHIIKKVTKPITKLINHIPGGNILAPIILTALGQPELAAGFSGINTLNNGGSLGKALLNAGLSYGGSALGGNNTIFGDSFSGIGKSIGDTVSGALGDFGKATGLSGLYNDASGALSNAYHSVSDTLGNQYNGSSVQDAFNSGKDALKSIGFNTGTSPDPISSTALAPQGGGGSSYSTDGFGQDIVKGNAGSLLSNIPKDISNLSDITKGASNVASSSNSYLSPIASLGIGSIANNSAQNALLKQANANKSLLAPYLNFKFSPGDLTQDPGYQFNLTQGNQALDRKALAPGGGGYFSGQALKEAQKFGQGLADNTYNSAFNRALQTNNAGLSGALATTGVNDSIGNTNAASAINQGNLFSGALGNILGGNSYTNNGNLQGGNDIQSFLRNLLKNGGSNNYAF